MKGLNKFAIHEAYNIKLYGEVYLQEFDPIGPGLYISDYITESRPAKKIIIKKKAGTPDSNYESTDYFTIRLNGNTDAGKVINIGIGDLPFTINGLMLTELAFIMVSGSGGGDSTNDYIDIISYH